MATKKTNYIGTTYLGAYGGSGGSTKINGGSISNGVVKQNLTAQAYPGSKGVSTTSVSSPAKTTSSTKTASTAKAPASSGYSSGGSSSGYSSAYDGGYEDRTAQAYSALVAAYQQQKRDYEEYLRQMREQAQNAYNNGMSALNSAYDTQMNSLSNNLNETRNQLQNSYNQSRTNINNDAESSLRQAYINHMLSQKNLGQQMSALGLSGGATETTLAGMLNNYGNARNNIDTTAANNLANLEGKYNDSISQAQQAYNSAVANANLQKAQYAMELESALANNQMSAMTNYQNLLQSDNDRYLDLLKAAAAAGANVSYTPTSADNAVKAIAVQQASNPAITTNYATLQALLGGNNTANNTQSVAQNVANQNYLAQILAQLGA